MKNLSKFVAVALIALSTACAQTQEETAAAAPAPTVEETNTEESSADNENAEPVEASTDETTPAAASSSKPKLDLPTQCLQPRIAGRCKARFSVFGFDPLKGKCVPYFYGGCEGSKTLPLKPATKHVIHPRTRLLKNNERVESLTVDGDIGARTLPPFAFQDRRIAKEEQRDPSARLSALGTDRTTGHR